MGEHVGYCRCCDQQIILDDDYGSEEKNNWMATRKCECPQGREVWRDYNRRENQIRRTHDNINGLFVESEDQPLAPVAPETTEAAVEILRAAVAPVVDKILYRVSVDIPGGVKASIGRSGKDDVAVIRSDAIKRKLES